MIFTTTQPQGNGTLPGGGAVPGGVVDGPCGGGAAPPGIPVASVPPVVEGPAGGGPVIGGAGVVLPLLQRVVTVMGGQNKLH